MCFYVLLFSITVITVSLLLKYFYYHFYSFSVLGWEKFMDGQSVHRGHLYISRAPQQVSAALWNNASGPCLLFYHPGRCMKTIEYLSMVICYNSAVQMYNATHCNIIRCLVKSEGWKHEI